MDFFHGNIKQIYFRLSCCSLRQRFLKKDEDELLTIISKI